MEIGNLVNCHVVITPNFCTTWGVILSVGVDILPLHTVYCTRTYPSKELISTYFLFHTGTGTVRY